MTGKTKHAEERMRLQTVIAAGVLALALASLAATGCKGEESDPCENPTMENDVLACRMVTMSRDGRLPKTISFADAQTLAKQSDILLELWKRAGVGEITREEFRREIERIDPSCEDIVDVPCSALFLNN